MSLLKISSSDTRSVYRSLLRSIQMAFKGDLEMVTAAKQEVRNRIEISRDLQDTEKLSALLDEGREAAEFLKTSIMQLGTSQDGTLTVELDDRHAGGLVEPITPDMELPQDGRNA